MSIIIKNGFTCRVPSDISIMKNSTKDCKKSCQQSRAPFSLQSSDVWTINVNPHPFCTNNYYWVKYSETLGGLVSINPQTVIIQPPLQQGNNVLIRIIPGIPEWAVVIKSNPIVQSAGGSGNVTVGDDNQLPHKFKKMLKELNTSNIALSHP